MNDEERVQGLRCVIGDLSRGVAELEAENASLRRLVKWLACELEKQSYSFTAEYWMRLAKEETRNAD